MAANVWMHILPSQKKMIAALKEGRKPDERLSARAKLRSKQNTFMAVPVVFIMISNHFPGVTYGDRYNWIILSVLVLWVGSLRSLSDERNESCRCEHRHNSTS
jgi:uncharacterized membrane protein